MSVSQSLPATRNTQQVDSSTVLVSAPLTGAAGLGFGYLVARAVALIVAGGVAANPLAFGVIIGVAAAVNQISRAIFGNNSVVNFFTTFGAVVGGFHLANHLGLAITLSQYLVTAVLGSVLAGFAAVVVVVFAACCCAGCVAALNQQSNASLQQQSNDF